MGHDGMVQTGKKKDLSKGLAINDASENKRAVACSYIIDCNKRGKDGSKNNEPKLTE